MQVKYLSGLAVATACLWPVQALHAGEVYGAIGMPGVMLGYAHPMNENLGLRADYATLGSHTKVYTESGIAYDGALSTGRAALLADWFPFAGRFRVTGGLTANNYKLSLNASGAGGTLQVGNTTYTTTAADGLRVDVAFPKTTPYLGIGWGHQASSGFRAAFDIGAMIGSATVTVTPRGQLTNPAAQADIQAETAQLRDGVGKVKAIPQISLSLGWSF